MSYDTALPTPAFYRRYVEWATLVGGGRALSSGSDARVLMGVPTYDTLRLHAPRGRRDSRERPPGVVAGLRGLGAGGTFEGVAIYADWTTDERDWAVYERFWRNRSD